MLRPINNEENLIKYKGLDWKNTIIKDTLDLYPDCTYIGLFGSHFKGDWYDGSELVKERIIRFKDRINKEEKIKSISDIDLIIDTKLPIINIKNYHYISNKSIGVTNFILYIKE